MNDTKTMNELCEELRSAAEQLAVMQRILTECAKMVLREYYTRQLNAEAEEWAEHDDMVQRATVGKICASKRYRIMNRHTLKWWEGEAYSAKAACEAAGWQIGYCNVWEHMYRGAGGWKTPGAPESKRKVEREK